MIRIIAGASEPFIRSSDREMGGCVLDTTLRAPMMGDEHLWRVPDCSGGNFSRGVDEEEILVMGIDCRPC